MDLILNLENWTKFYLIRNILTDGRDVKEVCVLHVRHMRIMRE